MSFSKNIKKLLDSNNDNLFYEMLEQIESNILVHAKKELAIIHHIDSVLFEAIDFSIKKLHEEENFISQILYNTFGIGKEKNRRRTQLLFLGNQLNIQINIFERDKHKIQFHQKKLSSSLEELTEIHKTFRKKIHFLNNTDREKRCHRYIKEVYTKIDEINLYQNKFELKSIYLESCLSKSHNLLKKIPRNHELKQGEPWRHMLGKA